MQPLTIAMLSIHSSPIGVLGTRDTGGMSVYVRELAREMGRNGHRVDIFTRRRHDGDPAVAELAPHVRLVSLDIAQSRRVAKTDRYACAEEALAAIDAFRRRQSRTYDLIHSHYWISGQVGRMARRCWQRPHVITFHTLGAPKAATGVGPAESARRLAIEKELVRDCDRLLAPCEGEKSNLMNYYGADAARIASVPGGVDLQLFRPLEKTAARKRLGLAPHGTLLLSIGRLTPQKGQDRIIRALARLGGKARPELVIAGGDGEDDPERQRLQSVAAEAGVLSRVHFTGSIPHHELPTWYAAADVYVLASHYESFGLVGLEALACGRPVVATPVGIMHGLARLRRPGVVVTGSSPDALAAGIAATRDRLPEWHPHAIRDAALEFSWAAAASAALAAYRTAGQTRAATRARR